MRKSFTVDEDFNNSRLDKWFKQKVINLPHSLIEKIIRNNKIKINKKKTKSSYRLQTGDLVEIFDINRFKPTDEKKKIKYLPKKKEIGSYDKYVLDQKRQDERDKQRRMDLILLALQGLTMPDGARMYYG